MNKNSELMKFLTVGVINTLLGAAIMFVSYNLIGLSYWLSVSLNYILAGLFSFFANKKYTFKSEGKILKEFVLFILTVIICYIIAFYISKKVVGIIEIRNIKTKENMSMVIGMLIYTVLNFILQKKIVFKN